MVSPLTKSKKHPFKPFRASNWPENGIFEHCLFEIRNIRIGACQIEELRILSRGSQIWPLRIRFARFSPKFSGFVILSVVLDFLKPDRRHPKMGGVVRVKQLDTRVRSVQLPGRSCLVWPSYSRLSYFVRHFEFYDVTRSTQVGGK